MPVILQFLVLFAGFLYSSARSECHGTCEGADAQVLLQLKFDSQLNKGKVASSTQSCKRWCHKTENAGVPWEDKCSMGRCSTCLECATTTTTTRPNFPPCELQDLDGSAFDMMMIPSGHLFTAAVSKPTSMTGQTAFSLEAPPEGLSVLEKSGVLTWQPDISQAGAWWSLVTMAPETGDPQRCLLELEVSASESSPVGLYVSPSHGSDSNAGTVEEPFETVRHAAAVALPGDVIYVRGGRYSISRSADQKIVASGTGSNPVIVTRLPGERVRFDAPPQANHIFKVEEESVGITFRGFELYGSADKDDVWEVVSSSWWRVNDTRVGGAMGFNIDGQHVVIEDCVIHDFAQKGVNVYMGRYVTVRNNVIYNIAFTSLTGGHGIMRQWERTFGNPDDPSYWRFDFYGNLVMNVEQRIYSYVPHDPRGCDMVIDEGKPILIDTTEDTELKSRVAHNLVLFAGADSIRVKWNPNIQILNNGILTEEGRADPIPDGITIRKDSHNGHMNGSIIGNLVQSHKDSHAFDARYHLTNADYPSLMRDNYYAGGGYIPELNGIVLSGFTDLGGAASVFKDPDNLDFHKHDSIPGDVGIKDQVLQSLRALVDEYDVNIAPTGWRHDHVKLTQLIVDSIPTDHLSFWYYGPGHKTGRMSYYYTVTSAFYQNLCECTTMELLLHPLYVEYLESL